MVRREGFGLPAYLAFAAATVFTLLVCVSLGSVKLPLRETSGLLWNALAGRGTGTGMSATIVFSVRLPRVLCVALTGASLSVCGAAMQGLLKNPLADGSTLGVSSGASLGAVISIAFGITLPGIPLAGTMSMAMLFCVPLARRHSGSCVPAGRLALHRHDHPHRRHLLDVRFKRSLARHHVRAG